MLVLSPHLSRVLSALPLLCSSGGQSVLARFLGFVCDWEWVLFIVNLEWVKIWDSSRFIIQFISQGVKPNVFQSGFT